jgi:hypothetical protein
MSPEVEDFTPQVYAANAIGVWMTLWVIRR